MRCFEISKIFSARSYHESIDWSVWQNDEDGNESEMVIYPFPPILRALSPYEINEWGTKQAPPKYPLPDLPCHSQAVERHIRLVSEASMKCSSAKERDGFVRNTKESQSKMPAFRSKKDFNV